MLESGGKKEMNPVGTIHLNHTCKDSQVIKNKIIRVANMIQRKYEM